MAKKFITRGRGTTRKVIPIQTSSCPVSKKIRKELADTLNVGSVDASLYVHLTMKNGEDLVLDLPKSKVVKLLADMEKGVNRIEYDKDRAVRISEISSLIIDDAETSAIVRPRN